ncbi:MAG: nucleotidyltransferase domain-containing protein [Flavobacterium sp.]|nr:nucleotidyltransferase domain-containing protein [Pedobacter sp.]
MLVDYVNIIREIVLKKVPSDKYAIFLFGSRAVGNAYQISDIDIGFLGDSDLPVMLRAEIENAIEESIVPFHVDLRDFNQVDSSFREEALKKIIVWNSPKNLKLNYQI